MCSKAGGALLSSSVLQDVGERDDIYGGLQSLLLRVQGVSMGQSKKAHNEGCSRVKVW